MTKNASPNDRYRIPGILQPRIRLHVDCLDYVVVLALVIGRLSD